MNQGFSLIEVLLALMLVSSMVLALMAQQRQSKDLLNQFIKRTTLFQHYEGVSEQFWGKR
ncbi:MAG: prepilin-type N-terminal cleavage/methylation domain-containing protein [Legionella sp.]